MRVPAWLGSGKNPLSVSQGREEGRWRERERKREREREREGERERGRESSLVALHRRAPLSLKSGQITP